MLDKMDVSLIANHLSNRLLIEDWTDNVTIADGFLKISGLSPGQYHLQCIMSKYVLSVKLFIIEDSKQPSTEQFWTNFRLGKRWAVESPGNSVLRPLTISQVSRQAERVKIQLQNWSNKTYAIVCGTTTLSHRMVYETFMSRAEKRQLLKWPVGQCAINTLFVSGRKLSEEYQYILERARYEKWTGTTLQQPSLLLKRQEQSQTSIANKTEKAAVGFEARPKQSRNVHNRMFYRPGPYGKDSFIHEYNLTPVYGK
jgi:hypothetical protein